jgi:integrase
VSPIRSEYAVTYRSKRTCLRNEIHSTEGLEVCVNHPLSALFDQFLKERLYLKNVTDRTLVWYRVAFKSYRRAYGDNPALPTKAALQEFVVRLRERGIRPVTCNTYIGAMNAFCVWLHEEGHIMERVKLRKLLIERRILTLLDDTQMRAVINYKPKGFGQARVQLAAILILDTGLRISEALNLRACDVDFDNLVIKAFGKGQNRHNEYLVSGRYSRVRVCGPRRRHPRG